jgi:hypothetical protein
LTSSDWYRTPIVLTPMARRLFYTGTQAPAGAAAKFSPASVPVPLGLRYVVLKRDPAGTYAEVDPNSAFQAGDLIRLQVEANADGYLYILTQGSSGTWKLLFPAAEVSDGSNLIKAGDSRVVPSSGSIMFDERPGIERLFLVLSRHPEPEIDQLIYAVEKPDVPGPRPLRVNASISYDTVNRLQRQISTRNSLSFEEVKASDKTGNRENAGYVVNPNPGPDAHLFAEIALRHDAGTRAGTLIFVPNTDGVEVVVDGVTRGTASKGKPLVVTGLNPGNHKIEGRKAGYQPDGPREETVYAGRERNVPVSIPPPVSNIPAK